MKVIRRDLGSEFNEIEIIPISDTHIGDKETNLKALKKTIDYIKNTPNVYTILNGDLLNNAIRSSVSDIYSATFNPEQQMDTLVELFEPIKDKILAVLEGNHEHRSYKETGIRITKNFCYRLGIVDIFTDDVFMLFVSFGLPFPTRINRRHTFSIFSVHGSSGGKYVGGKLRGVESLSGIIDADIYLHSHTHTPAAFKLDYFRSNSRTKTVQQVTKLFVNSTAWLGYGGYGAVNGYKPATIAPTKIKLVGDGKIKYANCEI